MSEIKEKVINVLSGVLNIPVSNIPLDAAPGIIEKWDSINHITLVLALEDTFEITFTDDELTDLISLELIIKIIAEKIGVNE